MLADDNQRMADRITELERENASLREQLSARTFGTEAARHPPHRSPAMPCRAVPCLGG